MAMTWGDYVLLCARVRDFFLFHINKKREKTISIRICLFVRLFVAISKTQ